MKKLLRILGAGLGVLFILVGIYQLVFHISSFFNAGAFILIGFYFFIYGLKGNL
jgi:hypothetical protein